MQSVLRFSSILILATAACTAVSAAPIAAKYCSAGGTHAAGISTADMKYGVNGPSPGAVSNATDCYGLLEKNGGDFDANGGNSTAEIINAIWGDVSGAKVDWGNGTFVELVKKDTGQSGSGANALGYTWSLDGSVAATTGSWTLSATPLEGLPAFFDFVGVLKGSNGSAAYLFDEVLFDGSSGGSWTIAYENNGNQIPALSNLTIYGRLGVTPPPPPPCTGPDCGGGGSGGGGNLVSAPGTLALVGLALFFAGAVHRRKHAA